MARWFLNKMCFILGVKELSLLSLTSNDDMNKGIKLNPNNNFDKLTNLNSSNKTPPLQTFQYSSNYDEHGIQGRRGKHMNQRKSVLISKQMDQMTSVMSGKQIDQMTSVLTDNKKDNCSDNFVKLQNSISSENFELRVDAKVVWAETQPNLGHKNKNESNESCIQDEKTRISMMPNSHNRHKKVKLIYYFNFGPRCLKSLKMGP